MPYTITCKPYIAQTHHAECWREASHWQCAVRVVTELIDTIEDMLDTFDYTCDCGECGPCQLAQRARDLLASVGQE